MSEARVVVVGTGYWGRNLARNFAALGALAGLCDVDGATLAAQAALYPAARRFASLDEALGEPDIDAVAIATPAATHGALARAALEAGKAAFVEKPLCLDLGEARSLGALARERGLTLMVGHLLLYHPAFVALRRFVSEGGIGRLRYVYAHRASLGRIRREENALWSFAPHDISMMLSLTGRLPTRVTCNGGSWLGPPVADTTLSHLDFGDDVQAHVFVSWLHPFKDHRLVVVGSDGMAVFDDVVAGPGKLLHYPHTIGWRDDLPTVTRAEAVPIAYEADEPLANECAHFLECLANGRTPLSDAEEGRRVLAVLDACQRALAAGRPMTLGDPA